MLRYWELELYHIFFFGQGRGHSSIYNRLPWHLELLFWWTLIIFFLEYTLLVGPEPGHDCAFSDEAYTLCTLINTGVHGDCHHDRSAYTYVILGTHVSRWCGCHWSLIGPVEGPCQLPEKNIFPSRTWDAITDKWCVMPPLCDSWFKTWMSPLPSPEALVLGGEGITEGGDGGVGKPGEELGCPLYGHLLGWALTNSDSLPNAFFHCLFLHLWNHRSKSASLPARPVPFYFSLLPHRLRAPCLVVQYLFTLWS